MTEKNSRGREGQDIPAFILCHPQGLANDRKNTQGREGQELSRFFVLMEIINILRRLKTQNSHTK